MRLSDYADEVEKEQVCGRAPWERTEDWGRVWNQVLSLLEGPGVHEQVGLTIAKCEFLGGLLTGEAESDVTHALAYARRFMPLYGPYHDLGGHKTAKSDLFGSFRNGPLYGVTPAGVHMNGQDDVVGWRIGERPHLTSTVRGSLRIAPAELRRDFVESVGRYADYLRQDRHDPTLPGLPTQRWRRSFWLRFCPAWYPTSKWAEEGIRRGVFAKL